MKNILTIIKKELRGYFNHPMAYILMVVFLVITYFFYFKPVLITGETTMRPLFNILPWILMFFVPAVTMGLLAKEKSDGTIETLMTQPIKPLQIILGKALSALLFIFITVLITLTIPLTLAKFGDFDWGLVFSQYLGSLFLIAGFVSIGIWASSVTKNQIVAFISSIAINFFLIFVGFEMVTVSLPYPLNIILKKISILGHFSNMARGVLDLRDVIYFVCLMAIFLFLSYWSFLKIKGVRRQAYKSFKNLALIIIIAALIVNLSGDFIKGRIDLTQGRIFTLSPATKDIISNLKDNLTISLFISKKLPAQIESQAQDVQDLLDDYVTRSNGKIKLIVYHPDTDDSAKTLAQQKGVPPIQFNVVAKDEFQVKQGYLGLSVEKEKNSAPNENQANGQKASTADDSEKIPFIQRTDNLEYQLTGFILKLTRTSTKNIAWLTGHGEKNLWQDFSGINQELSKQYKVDSLNLSETKDGKLKNKETTYKDIPDDTAVLVIAGPSQKISRAELGKINYYLNHGGSVLAMANQIVVNPQFMTATTTESNLNLMLNEWGVGVNNSLVYDLKSNENVTLSGGRVQYVLPYPMWVRALVNPKNNVLGNLKSVVLPWASSIKILNNKSKDNIKVIELLSTTKFAGEQKNVFDINPQAKLAQDNLNSKLLSVALEKNIDGQLSRLVVVGNVDFATDGFLQNSPENEVFMLNAIEWLSQDEALASIRSKNLARAPLVFTSDSQKNSVKYFNLIGVPFLVILTGILILWRRKKYSQRDFED